jgi:acyl-CoA synthetase (AMP-forming)/AMP-acid ligase II
LRVETGNPAAKIEDERLGEIGIAFVRLKKGQTATEEAIINYCQDKIAHIRE